MFRNNPKEVRVHFRYPFIYEFFDCWSANILCEVLEVSEFGYYRFRKNINRLGKDAILSAAMQEVLKKSPCNDNYDARRMQTALLNKGLVAGIRRIKRIMRENGWLHAPRRKPHGLTKATTEVQEKESVLKKDFSMEASFTKFLTDISQIPYTDGKLYISLITDCFNGEIIALQMCGNMRKELCIGTLKAASDRCDLKGAIIHPDCGSRYTSDAFRKIVMQTGLCQSLGSIECCYDNARMESFFATLKKELLYKIPATTMKKDLVKQIIFRYILTYYNQVRIYTSNPGGIPPATYRHQHVKICQALVA